MEDHLDSVARIALGLHPGYTVSILGVDRHANVDTVEISASFRGKTVFHDKVRTKVWQAKLVEWMQKWGKYTSDGR